MVKKIMDKVFGNEEPLGLPQGTVRAGMAIMMSLTLCVMTIQQIDVCQEFYLTLGTIIGFYFGSRK